MQCEPKFVKCLATKMMLKELKYLKMRYAVCVCMCLCMCVVDFVFVFVAYFTKMKIRKMALTFNIYLKCSGWSFNNTGCTFALFIHIKPCYIIFNHSHTSLMPSLPFSFSFSFSSHLYRMLPACVFLGLVVFDNLVALRY